MLDRMKGSILPAWPTEDIVLCRVLAEMMTPVYEEHGVEIPDWLDGLPYRADKALNDKRRERIESRLREARRLDEELKSKQRKRRDNKREMERLEQELAELG